jgi:hypothetical protein
MAVIAETAVALRIVGDDLVVEEITRWLGKQPTHCAAKGDVRIGKSERQTVARSGIWMLDASDSSPGDLSAQIVNLLSNLPADLALWRKLNERFKCNLSCGLFMQEGNEGDELSSEVLNMIAARGLRLGLDIYGPMS